MKKLIVIAAVFVFIFFSGIEKVIHHNTNSSSSQDFSDSDNKIAEAFESGQSDLQLQGKGKVDRLLADDMEGSRHQRFILRLISGHTILISHNIDIANKIASLKAGDQVEFNGEYEWNSQGGVIHWTHRDPKGIHVSGWLKHNGRKYH